jgi:starvation-inducible outer membrane lipoprotein
MAIFGDQSWKKIQQFLIYREKDSKKSKTIKKVDFTFRSVKAIQSKIYQIKSRVESEFEFINT